MIFVDVRSCGVRYTEIRVHLSARWNQHMWNMSYSSPTRINAPSSSSPLFKCPTVTLNTWGFWQRPRFTTHRNDQVKNGLVFSIMR